MARQAEGKDDRRVWRVLLLAALACGIAAISAPAAPAQNGVRQSSVFEFVEQRPGLPSALILNIDYVNPDDPGAKPPAVRTVVEQLAAGAQIDTSVPGLCTAPDAVLMAQGAAACPPESRVGSGSIRIDTGLPEPARFIDADVVFLNNTDQLIFVSTEAATGARVVTRSAVQGGQIVNSAPLLPGTPPDGAAIDVVQTRLDAISRHVDGVTRGYVTTPGLCPPGGAWSNAIDFTYADGVTQTVNSESPCTAATAAPPPAPGAAGKRCTCKKKAAKKRCKSKKKAAGKRCKCKKKAKRKCKKRKRGKKRR